ncbi:MAG: MFS transporter [Steroidobacterales bacterium]
MSQPAHGLAVLRHRDFTLYVGARFFASVAVQMLVVAVGWQVYARTGRLLDLGLIGLSQFLPFLCLALFAGHAADRYDRGAILIACACAQLACACLLLLFAVTGLAVTWPIFAVLALLGVARAFQMPTGQSLLPNLIPADMLGSAIALSSSTFQVATIAGPSVGGALYAIAERMRIPGSGAALVYAVAGVLLMVAMTMLALIRARRAAGRLVAVTWASLLEGLDFVWRRKTVLGAMSLDLFAVLFGGATALLPALTRDVLHAGPEVFGLLRTAPGVGAGLMALVLAFRPIRRHVGLIMFTGVACFGAMTVLLGLTERFLVALIALAVLGASDMVSVFIRSVLVQMETPDAIRGRVSAVNSIFIGASNELGEFESGVTAAWLGLVPAIVAGGVATLGITLLWAYGLFPRLRRLQSFSDLK